MMLLILLEVINFPRKNLNGVFLDVGKFVRHLQYKIFKRALTWLVNSITVFLLPLMIEIIQVSRINQQIYVSHDRRNLCLDHG